MRRRLLLITTLATMLLGSAAAEDNPLAGSTVTCSATPQVAGCYIERPVWTVGPLELALGVDTQAAYGGGRAGHLAPYVSAAWYGPTWSMWGELFMPHSNVPVIGRADWFRVGFTWRLE